MKITTFKTRAENILDKLDDLIEKMPQKGNTSSECQKLYIKEAISRVFRCINGTLQEDLIQ